MTVRLLLVVAFVADILVLVVCTETARVTATSVSSASASSWSFYASSSSSAKTVVKSKPVKCRRTRVCPDNERYSGCIQAECRALNCTQKYQSVPCIQIDPTFCKKGCVCEEGYLRNKNGICVLEDKCEPGLCPANEEYSSCIQQTCRGQNCSDRDLAMETCPTCYAASCQRGCVCQENYYRNDKGVCISYEECGGPMCPYAYEEYTPNFKECPPNICKSLVAKYACDENQKVGPGCMCKSGYLRSSLTTPCIPICDCPEMEGSPDC